MADPPASTPHMCEHTRGSAAGMSKSARLCSETTPHICERSFNDVCFKLPTPLFFTNMLQTGIKQGSLSGVPDYFGRNEISSGGDLSDYSSASLY